jgi:hypothetical protein
MVEVSSDGRLLADGTQVLDMAKVLPPPRQGTSRSERASRDALRPITQARLELTALQHSVRFDLPLHSYEHLKAVSEVLHSLARQLEGLSYMRHKDEAQVIREARFCVAKSKRDLRNI